MKTENQNYNLLKGKKGMILGISNASSIAYSAALMAKKNGADIVINYIDEKYKDKLEKIGKDLGASGVFLYNASDESSLDSLFENTKKTFGKIDFIMHSIAFSDKNELQGPYINTTRENMSKSMVVSVHSFTEVVKKFAPITNEGGSFITLSYYGSQAVIPNYNIMGACKAALECSVKYLAECVGKNNIRVNAISPGPIKTLAASAIGEFDKIMRWAAEKSPLRRGTTLADVSGTALFLFSNLSSGITGQTIYVDSGFSVLGIPSDE